MPGVEYNRVPDLRVAKIYRSWIRRDVDEAKQEIVRARAQRLGTLSDRTKRECVRHMPIPKRRSGRVSFTRGARGVPPP